MIRINELIKSETYQRFLEKNRIWELDRKFCRHGFDHMLAVARITYAFLLEQSVKSSKAIVGLPEPITSHMQENEDKRDTDLISKEVIYAAGLLHDIGRWVEYESGEDHAEASARLAEPLLLEYGFSTAESSIILEAIKRHRTQKRLKSTTDELNSPARINPLAEAIALADDWARDCFNCQAQAECYKYTSDWLLEI